MQHSSDSGGSVDVGLRCWKVTLAHSPPVNFVIWVRMDQLNEHPERLYLIPIAEFPEHKYICPSTLTLGNYGRHAHQGVATLFGLGDAATPGRSAGGLNAA